jgi:hypothetical protein
MTKHIKTFAAMLIVLIGCSENEVQRNPVNGYFTLSQLENENGRKSTTLNSEIGFHLGILKASREFYFLLGNGGDSPVQNITLETNHPQFIVSPSHIDLLPGKSSTGNAVIPLISLGVLHGRQLNGMGRTDLLPLGETEAVVTIKGTVEIDGTPTEVVSMFTMKVDAKVMDVTLFSNEEEIDYRNFNAQYVGFEFESGLPSIPGYDFDPANIRIKNTGNVHVEIRLDYTYSGDTFSVIELSPGESSSLNIPNVTDQPDNYFAYLRIESGGTITYQSRVKQGTDGKGHMILNHD